jgi:hypothetical protein
MWITDILQKLVPPIAAENEQQSLLNINRLQSVQVGLFKHGKIEPNLIIRHGEASFVDLLCELKVELDALLATVSASPLQVGIAKTSAQLENVMSQDIPFSQARELDSSLIDLLHLGREQVRSTRKRRSYVRNLMLIISVIPLFGYGVHWSIANYYQQALLDEVDFIYPESAYQYQDGIYQLRPLVFNEALENFSGFFFDDLDYMTGNPLPLAYDPKKADKWGAQIDPESDIANALELGLASARELNNFNLVMFRVFIRNIRERNIVNHLGVEVERIGENQFPWDRVDINTSLEFSIDHSPFGESKLEVIIETRKAPVLALDLSITLDSNDPELKTEYSHSVDLVTDREWLYPDFGPQLVVYDENSILLYIAPERVKEINLDPDLRRTQDQMTSDLSGSPDIDKYLQEFPYIFGECPDGGIAIFTKPARLQSLLGLYRVDALNILYNYELLDGSRVSGEKRLPLTETALILKTGIEAGFPRTFECIGEIAFELSGLLELETAAGAGGGWANLLDSFALTLMDNSKQVSPVIVAEETILFDFQTTKQKMQKTSSKIHILNDGEYILFNLAGTNFQGGDYRFKFSFDDEQVGEITVNLLWPQTTRFKPGDEKYFRPASPTN